MRGCTEGRALNKAERMAINRARIVSAGRRTIEVRGRTPEGPPRLHHVQSPVGLPCARILNLANPGRWIKIGGKTRVVGCLWAGPVASGAASRFNRLSGAFSCGLRPASDKRANLGSCSLVASYKAAAPFLKQLAEVFLLVRD